LPFVICRLWTCVVATTSRPPKWIKPRLTRLVEEAPAGAGWLHEIKCDGYRKHARIDGDQVKLLTGLLPFEERQEGATLVAVQSQASA
jgi:hypothetical protein